MKKNTKQLNLFTPLEWWKEHWQGMPEFEQEDLTPFKSIYVHFEKEEDMIEFSKLVNQVIHIKTQSIWYPKAKIGRIAGKKYVTRGYHEKP